MNSVEKTVLSSATVCERKSAETIGDFPLTLAPKINYESG